MKLKKDLYANLWEVKTSMGKKCYEVTVVSDSLADCWDDYESVRCYVKDRKYLSMKYVFTITISPNEFTTAWIDIEDWKSENLTNEEKKARNNDDAIEAWIDERIEEKYEMRKM